MHCGFHKCLTMYTRRTYKRACRLDFRLPRGFRHFHHRIDEFYEGCDRYRVCSVSGNSIDLNRFDDIRVVRFIRDPRDLLVSGYHYHIKGIEGWCHTKSPKEADWSEVRGAIPSGLPEGESLNSYLKKAPRDEGMRLELDFRRYHFTSMREWPDDDLRARVYRYEDILGNEVETFREILDFFGLQPLGKLWGLSYARRHAAGRRSARRDHIRNPKSGQWRDVLPEDVAKAVSRDYGDILARYGYPPD